MRNLKRALSLALASIMLLGMMVTGASAASSSFTDFDQIVNQEAAEVTSGLKIFEGYTDGSFGPERPVTRAEMAVIICKLLNGADVDPSNFSGLTKFTDVPGWAEGYVNYCNSMGIVVGVGDNKFDPNRTVSTVEAATMLLKALGYFVEEDQLKSDWKTVVTGRATSLKLYGDLTLAVDEPLTRDNVAELVFHTLFAQRVAYDDNRNLYVKNTDRDVVVTNGTSDRNNTLAMNTFGMWYIDGTVTGNSYTDVSLSKTTNNGDRTMVLFDAGQSYLGGTGIFSYPFEYETGLDMIGHAARVYYSMERNAPVVYAIVDRATKVGVITYDRNTARLSAAASDAGFRRNTIVDIKNYLVNYDWDVTWANNDARLTPTNEPNLSLILISNSSDYTVDRVIVLDQYLDTVRRVVNDEDDFDFDLTTRDGADMNILHGDAAEGDYVIVTDVGNQHSILNVTKAETQSAKITRFTGVSNGAGTVKSIVADGTEYVGSPVRDHEDPAKTLDNTTNFEEINTIGEATMILDAEGKVIALAQPETAKNYAYAAQFGVHKNNNGLNHEEALTVKLYFIDGTSGVYEVNTDQGTFDGYNYQTSDETKLNQGAATGGSYNPTVAYKNLDLDSNGHLTGLTAVNAANIGNGTAANGLGVYHVSVRSDNTVVMWALHDEDQEDSANRAAAAKAQLLARRTTLVATVGVAKDTVPVPPSGGTTAAISQNGVVTNKEGERLYQNNKTVYFYVDGNRSNTQGTYTWSNSGLTVGVRTGVANAVTFTHGGNKDDNKWGTQNVADEFVQVFADEYDSTNKDVDRLVSAVLVYGLEVDANDTMYFYNQGNYIVNDGALNSKADGKITLTYTLHDPDTGEVFEKTYDNGGKGYDSGAAAREEAEDVPTGYYEIGSSNLKPVMTVKSPNGSGNVWSNGKYRFVMDAALNYNERTKNIFAGSEEVGGIIDSAVIVNLTDGKNLDTVSGIVRALENHQTVKISYAYALTGDKQYEVKVVFVTSWDPKEISGGGVNRPTGGVVLGDDTTTSQLLEALNTNGTVTFNTEYTPSNRITVPAGTNLVVKGGVTVKSGSAIDGNMDTEQTATIQGVNTVNGNITGGKTSALAPSKADGVAVNQTYNGSVDVATLDLSNAGETAQNESGKITINGNASFDEIIAPAQNSTVEIIVNGTLSVGDGNTLPTIPGVTITVLSSKSLHVNGNLTNFDLLAIGSTTGNYTGAVTVSGDLNGKMNLQKGSLTVNGVVTFATNTTVTNGFTLTFGTSGSYASNSVSNAATNGFQDANGGKLNADQVGGLTFTYDSTKQAFVSESSVPLFEGKIYFVNSLADLKAAQDGGSAYPTPTGPANSPYGDFDQQYAHEPWILIGVKTTEKDTGNNAVVLKEIKVNGTAVEMKKAGDNATPETSLSQDNSKGYRFFHFELLSGGATGDDQYLNQSAIETGNRYEVTLEYKGQTQVITGTYGGMTLPRAVSANDVDVSIEVVYNEAQLRSLYAQGLRWDNNSTSFESSFIINEPYKNKEYENATQIDAQLGDNPWLLVKFHCDNPALYDSKVTLTKIAVGQNQWPAAQAAGTGNSATAYPVADWIKPAENGRPAHTFWDNFNFKNGTEGGANLGMSALPNAGDKITVTYTVQVGRTTETKTVEYAFPTYTKPVEKAQAPGGDDSGTQTPAV
jgi:hypothetical protein